MEHGRNIRQGLRLWHVQPGTLRCLTCFIPCPFLPLPCPFPGLLSFLSLPAITILCLPLHALSRCCSRTTPHRLYNDSTPALAGDPPIHGAPRRAGAHSRAGGRATLIGGGHYRQPQRGRALSPPRGTGPADPSGNRRGQSKRARPARPASGSEPVSTGTIGLCTRRTRSSPRGGSEPTVRSLYQSCETLGPRRAKSGSEPAL